MKKNKKLHVIVLIEIVVVVVLIFAFLYFRNAYHNRTAFERIQEKGYRGTQEEFLASLAGEVGGEDTTAYALACKKGFKGELVDWFDILLSANDAKAVEGDSDSSGEIKDRTSYEIAREKGFEGSEKDWIVLLVRASDIYSSSGLSTYDIAVECGYTGSLPEWLDSLTV